MKKLLYLFLLIFLFIPSMSFSDEVDDALPAGTPERVKASVRNNVNLGVNNSGLLEMTRSMLNSRFSENQMIEAHKTLMNAKGEDLPVEPLMNKLHEGIAKQIKAEKILQAMEKVRSRYERANRLAGAYTQNKEQARSMTMHIADCMSAGVENADMEKIMERLMVRKQQNGGEDDLEKETLRMTRMMALSRARSKDVTDVVESALKMGYNAKEMNHLGKLFMSMVGSASSASDLARSYSNAINQGMSANRIQNLFSGPGNMYGNTNNNAGGIGRSTAGGSTGGSGAAGRNGTAGGGGRSGGGGRGR